MADSVQQVLEELGQKSPDEIAAFLEAQGITGRRGSATQCPVANYLYAQTGKMIRVGPIAYHLVVIGPGIMHGPNHLTPKNVGRFIAGFDDDDYAQLRSVGG